MTTSELGWFLCWVIALHSSQFSRAHRRTTGISSWKQRFLFLFQIYLHSFYKKGNWGSKSIAWPHIKWIVETSSLILHFSSFTSVGNSYVRSSSKQVSLRHTSLHWHPNRCNWALLLWNRAPIQPGGEIPAKDRGMSKANGWEQNMMTFSCILGKGMQQAPWLRERFFWEFSEKAAQGCKGKRKFFPLSPLLPAVSGCGSWVWTAFLVVLAWASPSEETSSSGESGSWRDTPLQGLLTLDCASSSHSFPNQNFH